MKRYITTTGIITLLIFCFTMGDAIAGKRLLDDFSGTYMDQEKWQESEFVRVVAGGKLVSKLGNSDGSGYFRNVTSFQNPGGINKITCTITVVDVKTDTGDSPISWARIGGTFYNVQNSGGGTGDIWAEIQIGDRGSGLEVWYEVEKVLDDERKNWEVIGGGVLIPPGVAQTGTPYPVELEYTNGHDIIFRAAGQSATFPDAGRQRPPVLLFKQLGTCIDADGGSGTGYVSALFDDVFINNEAQAYDTFNSAFIDTTKWNEEENIREISNSKLRMDRRICNPAGNSQTQNVRITSIPVNFDRRYIEIKVLIKSDTQVPVGQTGYARFGGWYYNDSRGPGSGQAYNENEGNVLVNIRLLVNDNRQLEAVASVWRSDDTEGMNGQSLLSGVFPTTISYNTEYTLSIEFTSSKIIFRCNDLAPIIYEVQTPIYDPYDPHDSFGLDSVVFVDPGQCGYIKATFDDVYIFSSYLPAIPLLLLD